MGIFSWLTGIFGGRRPPKEEQRVRIRRRDIASDAPTGDLRGHYGFGRRAHRPDPAGRYRFDAEPHVRTHGPHAS